MINKHPYFMYIAARGQGKSYLIAIYYLGQIPKLALQGYSLMVWTSSLRIPNIYTVLPAYNQNSK